jgi:hypothetical protein
MHLGDIVVEMPSRAGKEFNQKLTFYMSCISTICGMYLNGSIR